MRVFRRCPFPWQVAVALAVASPVAADIIRVDSNAPGGNNGSSWIDAFVDLRDALLAAKSGDEIRIAAGTYRPDHGTGIRTESFVLPDGIVLLGGYPGHAAPDPDLRNPVANRTILSGDIGVSGDMSDNTYRILVASNTGASTLLDGLVFSGGRADAAFPNNYGGAIYGSSAQLFIHDCEFSDNFALAGGAIHLSNGSAPTITSCAFLRNTAQNFGGAINGNAASPFIDACEFFDNRSESSGGAISTSAGAPEIWNSTFENNSTQFFGGAVYSFQGTIDVVASTFRDNYVFNDVSQGFDGGGALYFDSVSPTVSGCRFVDNFTTDDGSAIFSRSSTLNLRASVFLNNFAGSDGGALRYTAGTGQVRSCLMVGNTALSRGGAIDMSGGSLVVANSTIVANRIYGLGGGGISITGGTPLLRNSVLWSNSDASGTNEPAQVRQFAGTPIIVDYCCMQAWTGSLQGIGNISVPPTFVDADGPDNVFGTDDDDLHLRPFSPCVNGGDPAEVIPPDDNDMDGQGRVMGCRIDIGADEFPAGQPGSGDMNADGVVNGADLQRFTGALVGPAIAADLCVADLNADLVVDQLDEAIFLSAASGLIVLPLNNSFPAIVPNGVNR